MSMKYFSIVFVLLLWVGVVEAFNPEVVAPERPYDVTPIEGDLEMTREFLGSLQNYPQTFEFTATGEFNFSVKLLQPLDDELTPFNLIVVREVGRNQGVTEIARLNQPATDWQDVQNSAVAANFKQSRTIEAKLQPGTYRMEVSTPRNDGDYLLIFGGTPVSSGYFTALSSVWRTQQHFGYSPLRILLSPYTYYPIVLLVLIVGSYLVYRRYTKDEYVS